MNKPENTGAHLTERVQESINMPGTSNPLEVLA